MKILIIFIQKSSFFQNFCYFGQISVLIPLLINFIKIRPTLNNPNLRKYHINREKLSIVLDASASEALEKNNKRKCDGLF